MPGGRKGESVDKSAALGPRYRLACPRCGSGLGCERAPSGLFVYYCLACMWGHDDLVRLTGPQAGAPGGLAKSAAPQLWGSPPARGAGLLGLWLLALLLNGLPVWGVYLLAQPSAPQTFIWVSTALLAVYWLLCWLAPIESSGLDPDSPRLRPMHDHFSFLAWAVRQLARFGLFCILLPGRVWIYALFSMGARTRGR